MKNIEEWLEAYGESHQNPINKSIHWVCVPVILITLIGVLWSVKIPLPIDGQVLNNPLVELLNLGVALMVCALIYYAFLSLSLMIGMLIVSIASILAVIGLDRIGQWVEMSVFQLSLALFVVAWIGQFIGHKIEGKKPSFFEDLQFLLIGPLWLLSFIYRRLGIKYSSK